MEPTITQPMNQIAFPSLPFQPKKKTPKSQLKEKFIAAEKKHHFHENIKADVPPLPQPPKKKLALHRRHLCGRSPPLLPAQQIHRRPHLQQRIVRRRHALDTRNRIEDDLLLRRPALCLVLQSRNRNPAQFDERSGVGPMDRDVVGHVPVLCYLRHQAERDRTAPETLVQFGLEIIRALFLSGRFVEGVEAEVGRYAVPYRGGVALAADEVEGMQAIVLGSGVAGRGRFRCSDKGAYGRAVAQEGFYRGGMGCVGRGCRGCLEEGEHIGAGAGGEERGGVGDDVGVTARAEMEANGDPAGIGIGVGVGDGGETGRVGEADGDGAGWVREMGGTGEGLGVGRGGEGAVEEESFGMGCRGRVSRGIGRRRLDC